MTDGPLMEFAPDSPYAGWEHALIEYKHPRTGTRHLRCTETQSTACGKPVDRLETVGAIDPLVSPWIHPLNCTKCQRALERGSLGFVIVPADPPCEGYVTRTGRVLTEEDIERLAEEAELGYDVGHLIDQPSRWRGDGPHPQPIEIWPDAYHHQVPKDKT